jgi:hypothetical protein
MAINPLGFPTPGAFGEANIDWTPLANLGNVYRQGQEQAATQRTLAQLGQDPAANNALLIKSGVPALVTLGLNQQNTLAEQQRQAAQDAERRREFELNYGLAKQRTESETMTQSEKLDDMRKWLVAHKIDPDSDQGMQILYKFDPGVGRRAEEELKIRQSQEQRQVYRQNVPEGFMQGPNGMVVPIPGGPQDPTYLGQKAGVVAGAEAAAQASQPRVVGSSVVIPNKVVSPENPSFTPGAMAPPAVDFMARYMIANGKLPPGYARDKNTINAITNRLTELSRGDPETGLQPFDASQLIANARSQTEQTAEARSTGAAAAKFGMAESELGKAVPLMIAASGNVSRTSFPKLNEWILGGKTQAGDPNVARLLVTVDAVAKAYARTINPTGQTRAGDIDYARKLLSSADSDQVLQAKADQLLQEAAQQRAAIEEQKARISGTKSAAPAVGAATDTLEKARAALKAGADPKAVKQRLIDNGINPQLLFGTGK